MNTDRRTFIKASALAASGTLLMPNTWGSSKPVAPSNRLTMGVIGCGNQGMNDIRAFLQDPRVQIIAVCDVNKESDMYWDRKPGGREVGKREVESHEAGFYRSGRYKGCDTYIDYREMLARPDIDMILIDTPDHWHARQLVDSIKAGKDVYGQKPLSLTIREGQVMRDVVHSSEQVFQTGSQQRSAWPFIKAVNLIRNGYLGDLEYVEVGLPGGHPDFAKVADRKMPEPVPEGFDYDRWLGPAPYAPYAPARCHVTFRWIYDYSGGQITDWGAHNVDCAMWGAGVDLTGPREIKIHKAEFEDDPLWNTVSNFHFELLFDNGVRIDASNDNDFGVTYHCKYGWIKAGRKDIDASSPEILEIELKDSDERVYQSDDHYKNFVDAVIARSATAAPIEKAHRAITPCHLANIAIRLGRNELKWDPVNEKVINDIGANDMLRRPYRSPWKYPEV